MKGVRELGWLPFSDHLWQRNYYDHIIRGEEEWKRAHLYIVSNPVQWSSDHENPASSLP